MRDAIILTLGTALIIGAFVALSFAVHGAPIDCEIGALGYCKI